MQFSAGQISQIINGKVEGDENVAVHSFGKIEEASNGQLSFLANPKYEDYLYTSKASVIIINENLKLKQPVSATLLRVPDAYSAFATLLDKYQQLKTQQLNGIEQPVFIHATARMGDNVYLGAFVYVGENVIIGNDTKIFPGCFIGSNVEIGEKTILHAGTKIYNGCRIGNEVIIHGGTVIGSDGFGFAPQANGELRKVPQIGNVVVEDKVEIGANCSIDRATIGSTLIKKGAKLDNLLQIAHNVEIGNNVMIGGQAGIVGHIQIADGSKINAQSGVSKSLKNKNMAVTGTPAYEYSASLRSQALIRKLPELEKRISDLEKIIIELRAKA